MTISIIIPAYNSGRYLDECLESLFRQDIDVSEYEIIIVNDGSTDNTPEITRKWSSCHRNIRVISQENQGLSQARNAGIDIAEGDFIMFVDSDDIIADNTLGRIISECLTHQPDMLRICAADMTDKGLKRRYSYRKFNSISCGKDLMYTAFQVCAPFSIYRRSFLEAHSLRFHPGIFHEDNEFTPKAYYYAIRIRSIDDVIYHVRQTPDSITRSSNPKKSLDLLKVVELLESFSLERVEVDYRRSFDKQMADCLNTCFKNMLNLKRDEKNSLTKTIYRRRSIFRHFLRSTSVFHRIEGVLLTIFPRNMLGIYTMLTRLRRLIA